MRSSQWRRSVVEDKTSIFDLAFFVRFVFGLLGGAAMGLAIVFYTGLPLPTVMMLSALICGPLAAFSGDDFWRNFGRMLAWICWW